MITIDDILGISSAEEFERAALEVFAFQARECAPYGEYLRLIGADPATVRQSRDIPFMPIELFKSHDVYCGKGEPQIVFTSSNTGGTQPSRHAIYDITVYEKTFRRCFELFYGSPDEWSIYALLPSYLEREGSSLVYMADRLIAQGRGGGFYLGDLDRLAADIAADNGKRILLGVSYALWDLAERIAPDLHGVTVMETGGMKGRREELPKEEFHALLCGAFGTEAIHSEYGMAELTSQAYSYGGGIFRAAPWMKIYIRDLNDPFAVHGSGSGGIDIIDLANLYSCAFIQTQDVGTAWADGSFEIKGRADRSETRGCNLLIA